MNKETQSLAEREHARAQTVEVFKLKRKLLRCVGKAFKLLCRLTLFGHTATLWHRPVLQLGQPYTHRCLLPRTLRFFFSKLLLVLEFIQGTIVIAAPVNI